MKKKFTSFRSFQIRFAAPQKKKLLGFVGSLVLIIPFSVACSFPSTPTIVPPTTAPPKVTKGMPSDTYQNQPLKLRQIHPNQQSPMISCPFIYQLVLSMIKMAEKY